MEPFDLVVVDEAHRTSGSAGKAWADVHRQEVIPARRRLYMTATPRTWAERPPRTREQERLERELKESGAGRRSNCGGRPRPRAGRTCRGRGGTGSQRRRPAPWTTPACSGPSCTSCPSPTPSPEGSWRTIRSSSPS
ncbi:DEAD/DEAH box helicase family protein [Streptomyces sp. AB3(2024)]|uniref:DEAD/DEAH box helicase family protein n=1 Tax=Streptomyces sp. AB3(2024) TaxID=3317321 RepID=UPI0035A2F1B3